MSRSPKSLKRAAARPAGRLQKARKSKLGALPEWSLADLYSGIDDPAIKRDLDRIDADCVAFEEAHKGKLADIVRAAAPGAVMR